jgi:hypothetical protein
MLPDAREGPSHNLLWRGRSRSIGSKDGSNRFSHWQFRTLGSGLVVVRQRNGVPQLPDIHAIIMPAPKFLIKSILCIEPSSTGKTIATDLGSVAFLAHEKPSVAWLRRAFHARA